MADIGLTKTRNLMYDGVTYWVGWDGVGIKCRKESRSGVLLPFPDGTTLSTVAAEALEYECGFDNDSRGNLFADVPVDGDGTFDRYRSRDMGSTWTRIIEG